MTDQVEPQTTNDQPERSDSTDSTEIKPSLWQRLRARRSTRWAIDIALVLVILFAISAFQSRHLLSGDDPLPPMQVEGLDGSTLNLADLDKRRTVIYFWATWCGACGLQSGAISSLHDSAGDDLDVISIVLHYESRDAVERHVQQEGIDYPVYLGTDALAHEYKVNAFPTTYIVDDQLRVRHGLVGYKTSLGLRARLLW